MTTSTNENKFFSNHKNNNKPMQWIGLSQRAYNSLFFLEFNSLCSIMKQNNNFLPEDVIYFTRLELLKMGENNNDCDQLKEIIFLIDYLDRVYSEVEQEEENNIEDWAQSVLNKSNGLHELELEKEITINSVIKVCRNTDKIPTLYRVTHIISLKFDGQEQMYGCDLINPLNNQPVLNQWNQKITDAILASEILEVII